MTDVDTVKKYIFANCDKKVKYEFVAIDPTFQEYERTIEYLKGFVDKKEKITLETIRGCPIHETLRERQNKENKKLRYNFVGEGIYICGKCNSNKTSYLEKQTRSADEPMTIYIKCHKCGAKWKQ